MRGLIGCREQFGTPGKALPRRIKVLLDHCHEGEVVEVIADPIGTSVALVEVEFEIPRTPKLLLAAPVA